MSHRIERRTVGCRFQSLQDLITYYRCYLPESQIDMMILEAGRNFVSRTYGTPEQERLQFIRRCEAALEAKAQEILERHRYSVVPHSNEVNV